jgi:hypothetical protein
MKKIFFCLFIFFPTLLFGQYEYVRKYMFVTAPDGLEVRMSPSNNSIIRGNISYGEYITIYQRTIEKYTIDGVDDYFYNTSETPNGRWLFGGGYLSERLNSNPFLGRWAQDRDILWIFKINNWFQTGKRYTGGANSGDFELGADNRLSLISKEWDDEKEEYVKTTRVEAKVRFINPDRMILMFNNYSVELVRDNNL